MKSLIKVLKQAWHKTDAMRSYKGLPKPKLEDFYDTSDPRGCSSSEYEDYVKAIKKWKSINLIKRWKKGHTD